jgi:3-methylfumaryl-CoA hydratase
MNKLVAEMVLESPMPEPVVRSEVCTLAAVRRVAAMLDLNPDDFQSGTALPRGWQFILMAADTQRSLLRADGFPGLGVVMPDLGLPRLLLGGKSVRYHADIPIGAALTRKSTIRSLEPKSNQAGPLVIVTIEHELHLHDAQAAALVETQTYVLLPASRGSALISASAHPSEVTGLHSKTVVPNETLLFQYSALGFNSHKIHLDRSHARNVEGFPDLVVNGGLATLLMTDFLRCEAGIAPSALKIRHVAPLFCGSPITMVANKVEDRWHVKAYDHRSTLAVDMEVVPHEF